MGLRRAAFTSQASPSASNFSAAQETVSLVCPRSHGPGALRVRCECLTAQNGFRVNRQPPQVETGSRRLPRHAAAPGGPGKACSHRPGLLVRRVPSPAAALWGQIRTSAPASSFRLSRPHKRASSLVLGAIVCCHTDAGVFLHSWLGLLSLVSLETTVSVCVTACSVPVHPGARHSPRVCATCSPAQ